MKKTIKLLLVIIIISLLAWWFLSKNYQHKQPSPEAANDSRIKIVTTLFPLYDLARSIGGERVVVELLLPPGVSPHAFEPSPSEMLLISQGDLFVYTGDYLEPWAAKLISSLKNAPQFLVLGENLNTLEPVDDHGHDHADSDEHEHEEENLDPHIWLDPILMITMAERFTEKLIELDLASTDYYLNNLAVYRASLLSLDADFQTGLRACQQREIIYCGHYAFGYLARRYNLVYEAAQGFSPDAESTPSRLTDLVKMLKEHQTDYLFAGKLENQQLVNTLANEAQIEVLSLHTIHNLSKEEKEAGLSYLDLMHSNLNNLKIGLKCH